MPEVFAVETSLVLNDRMLKGLVAISKELRTIDGQMKKLATDSKIGGMGLSVAQAQALEKAMRGAATGARQAAIGMRDMRFGSGVVAGAEKLNTSLGSAAVKAAALRAEMAGINSLGGGPGFRGPRGPGGGGGGHFHGRMHAGPFGAAFPFSAGEMAAILAGGAAFVGIKGAAQEQQSINAAILASGIDPRSAQGQQYSQILFGQAEQISRGSIFSPATVAKAFPSIFGLTDVPFKDALPLLMPVTRFAETAALVAQSQGQSASIEESAKSAIRMAHVLGTLDPDKMAPLLNQMLVAEQTTGTTPAQMEKVLSYFAGTGRMFGMTPAQAIQLAAISSLGQPGTRAGTSLNQMILGLLPAGGPGSGTKIHLGQKFRQNELLRMGLIDPKTGRPYSDPVQILGALAKFRQQHPQEAIEAFKKMFNTRGMRAAEWLSFAGVMDKLVELQERMGRSLDANDMQKALRMSGLIPELQSNWADLQGILTTLGSSTLPGLISGFEHLHEALDFIRGALTDDKGNATPFAKNLAFGGEALGALWLTKLLWKIGRFPFLPSGAPGGVPGAVNTVGSSLLMTVLRPLAIAKVASELFDNFSIFPTQGDVSKGWKGNWSAEQARQYQSENHWGWLTNVLSELNPFHISPAYGGEPGVGAGGKGIGPITMTGTTTLNGTVTINMGEFGALVAKMVATGISRAASGGASGSGARPDLGHPLPHPSSAF